MTAAERDGTLLELARSLLRVDTSNPPGNETPAALLLREFLEASGVECRLVGRRGSRANLIARIRGGGGPSLAFVGHLDVVPASPEVWSTPPFAGVVRDGWLRGRGAVDMKGPLAAWAAALASLAREDARLPGDVLLIAAADEEVGEEGVGMPWLVDQHPRLVRADFYVGEGAGERHGAGDRRLYLYSVGEKPSTSATVVVRGRPGDPSVPANGGNPLPQLAELLARVARHAGSRRPHECLAELLAVQDPAEPLKRLLDALVRVTLVPTVLQAPGPGNVVPHETRLEVRCGLPPGLAKDDLEQELRRALGPASYELSVGEPLGGTVSPAESPLRDAIRDVLADEDPGAELLPTLAVGYTDLHLLREAFGSCAYGFIPFAHADPDVNLATKHGADERVRIDDLELQRRVARSLARAPLER